MIASRSIHGTVLTIAIVFPIRLVAQVDNGRADARQRHEDEQRVIGGRLELIERRLKEIEKALEDSRLEQPPTGEVTFPLFPVFEELPKRRLWSFGGEGQELKGDSDGDGLTDDEEIRLGTDKDDPDTDGDALPDGWEVHGVNGIDLHGMGASPLHKDIFVEMDFMERASATNGLGPNAAVIQAIVSAFSSAPVINPDKRKGINAHLEVGTVVDYDDDLNPLFVEFAALKRAHFDPNRAPVFHYMVWANAYDGGTSSGNAFDIPSSDFVVTLGRWNGGQGGTQAQKVGTFIHELGHNLGLMHGGSEHTNFKPNHLSVMNYSFQLRGV